MDNEAGPYSNQTVVFLGSERGIILKFLAKMDSGFLNDSLFLEELNVYNPERYTLPMGLCVYVCLVVGTSVCVFVCDCLYVFVRVVVLALWVHVCVRNKTEHRESPFMRTRKRETNRGAVVKNDREPKKGRAYCFSGVEACACVTLHVSNRHPQEPSHQATGLIRANPELPGPASPPDGFSII